MATRCFVPLLGKRIRVTALDDCGNVPAHAATNAFIVTDGFVSVSLSSDSEDGAEIVTKKANGDLCVNEKFASSFKRFNVDIEFCEVNPALLSLITQVTPYEGYTAGDVIGFTVAEGFVDKKFALEMWTGMSGAACDTSGAETGGYILLPYMNAGMLGDVEIGGEDAITFSMSGAYTLGSNTWGIGPYEVMQDDTNAPAALPTALDPFDHLLMAQVNLSPPPAACDPQPMP